jgi:hypothetical protein
LLVVLAPKVIYQLDIKFKMHRQQLFGSSECKLIIHTSYKDKACNQILEHDSFKLPVAGRLMLHKCLVDEPVVSEISNPRQLSFLEKVEPIPRRFRKPFGFANGLFLSSEASVYHMRAKFMSQIS